MLIWAGVSSLVLAVALSALKRGMYLHAERHLAKAGGSKAAQRGGVSPTLGEGAAGGTERAKRSGGLHKHSAEDWGYPCAARSGQSPLARDLATVPDREADASRMGVAGRNDPLRWVVEDAQRLQRGRRLPPNQSWISKPVLPKDLPAKLRSGTPRRRYVGCNTFFARSITEAVEEPTFTGLKTSDGYGLAPCRSRLL